MWNLKNKVDFIETEQNGGFQGLGVGENGRCRSEGTNCYKKNKFLISNVQHGDYIIIWYCILKSCWIDLKHSQKKELTVWGDGYANYLLNNHSTRYTDIKLSYCTINMYNYICKLFLNKVGKK